MTPLALSSVVENTIDRRLSECGGSVAEAAERLGPHGGFGLPHVHTAIPPLTR
jgi:hypothetical protein